MLLYIILMVASVCLAAFIIIHRLTNKSNDFIINGSFFVNGEGKMAIDLFQSNDPEYVSVSFSDDFNTHPCNHNNDELSWKLVSTVSGCLQLVIFFNVKNIREISYEVVY